MRSLGLFCGTFNPIHNGHLLIAESARDQFELDTVLFVTSASPPHRKTGLLGSEERHEMVQAATADNPYFTASRLELDREGPSYTADTVLHVRKLYGPATSINLIIGGDNVRTVREWNKAEVLIRECRFLVAPRLVYERALAHKAASQRDELVVETIAEPSSSTRFGIPGGRVAIIDFPAVSISSSMVRKRLLEKRSVLYMVPKVVSEILLARGHYASPTDVAQSV